MQLISSLILLGLFWLAIKAFSVKDEINEKEEEPETELGDYLEISETINDLNDIKKRIDTINDMILDIQTCKPGQVHKTVSVKVLESDRVFNFTVTGENDASEFLVQILESEREIHSTSLRNAIKKFNRPV